MNWRIWITYPEYIPVISSELMDTIEDLTGIDNLPDDRYSAIMDFLNNANDSGIINQIECDRLKNHVAQQL